MIGQPVFESVQNSELWAIDLGVFFKHAACFLSSIRARLTRVAVPRAAERVATRYNTLQHGAIRCNSTTERAAWWADIDTASDER